MEIRDRIVGLERIKASDLVPHPMNWRVHPDEQRSALQGILSDVGYVDALLARQLDDGRYQLIDGHLRAETTPDAEVPVLVVDLDDDEAAKVLATFDPIAGLAETDPHNLQSLLSDISTDDEGLSEMLEGMAEDVAELLEQVECENDGYSETHEDEPPEPPEDPVTHLHRMASSESMSAELLSDWSGLMCGVFANMPLSDAGQILVNLGPTGMNGSNGCASRGGGGSVGMSGINSTAAATAWRSNLASAM